MNQTSTVEISVQGKPMKISSGLLAKQAAGSTTVQLGETVVFSAVTTSGKPRAGADFFPLQVEYR